MRLRFLSLFLLLFNSMSIYAQQQTPGQQRNSRQADGYPIEQRETRFNTGQYNGHLAFVENKGQIKDQYGNLRNDIDFRLSSNGVTVFIGRGQLHYQWSGVDSGSVNYPLLRQNKNGHASKETIAVDIYRMDVHLKGKNDKGRYTTSDAHDYYEKYYLPAFGEQGQIARSFNKITYQEIYPNIDWVLYIKDGQLEYDFVVHQGGKVSDIQIAFDGATQLNIDEGGSFVARTPMGYITEAAPYSFDEDGKTVASSFLLSENILSFHTGAFHGKLVIDPVVKWATYIGGNGYSDWVNDVATDRDGNVYAAGRALSTYNIATTGAYQVTMGNSEDGYIKKFNSNGLQQWGTYYGGTEFDEINSIACDSLGFVYIAGATSSIGMATSGSHQPQYGGGAAYGDAFFAKFDGSGKRLWSSYYGGAEQEFNIRLNLKGAFFTLSGITASADQIATPGTHSPDIPTIDYGGAFVVKFDLDGKRIWGTYYGGESGASNGGVAIDGDDNIYLVGYTESMSAIATSGSHQPNKADSLDRDLFLVKFNKDGQRVWATYYGGEEDEMLYWDNGGSSVACDDVGNVYLCGFTKSTTNIATPGSYQSSLSSPGQEDVFFVKFDSSGIRKWGTYYGGPNPELIAFIHYVDSNNIYLTGTTESTTGITTSNAFQSVHGGGAIYGDIFISKFNGAGDFLYGSYYGGSGWEFAASITDDGRGNIYIGGFSNSINNIATPGSHQDTFPGAILGNGIVAKICFEVPELLLKINGEDSICANNTITYMTEEMEDVTDYIWTLPTGWKGVKNGNKIDLISDGSSGTISLKVVRCDDTSAAIYKDIHVRPGEPAEITVDGFVLSTVFIYQSYQWMLDGEIIHGATGSSYKVSQNGDYQVITENELGCIDTSKVYKVDNASSIDMHKLASQIHLFPNPVIHRLMIQSPVSVQASITSIDGRLILPATNTNSVDLSSFQPGVYIIHITDKEGVILKREKITKIQ